MKHFNTDFIFLQTEDARVKLREAASILKKSPQRLKYTLKMMEKEGIINSPHCIFDYSYFGQIMFRVYFKGGYISERDKGAIIEKLKENPYVVSIYELSGEFDLAIEIESRNPSRFNKELKNVADLIPTLNNYKVLLNIVTHIYPKKYLLRDIEEVYLTESEIIVGGDREVQKFSEEEMRMVKSLLLSPKKRYSRLAKDSGMNVKTYRHLMNVLKEKKIIRGFKYLADNNKLKVSRFRLFLKLHNMNKERDSLLLGFMKATKEIVAVNKTVGDWDMEVDIEAFEQSRIRLIIRQLREEFKDSISSFNLIEFTAYHKREYLPIYLFEGDLSGENQ